jgi:hypothetical protein
MNEQDAVALHTVTVCDLSGGRMRCEGDAVLGPPGRVFYVSPSAVYVWVSDWSVSRSARAPSTAYRIPLSGGRPTALGVRGSPVDQFSFLEQDGRLNVVVRADGSGDGMWAAEEAGGATALLQVPVAAFRDGSGDVPRRAYRRLPSPAGYAFQNRFVGRHLLYGAGTGWGPAERVAESGLFVVPLAGGEAVGLPVPHAVDRIEAMGGDAVVIGSDGADLHFSGVSLGGAPRLAQHYVSEGATQGELRSHGFFYKPDGAESGVIGLPLASAGRPGYEHLFEGSASIVFIRNRDARFTELGQLAARTAGVDDDCRASCVDWYGNARPIFLRGRTFALLGYEIVEGVVQDGRIRERRRISYAPGNRELSSR